MLKKLIAMFVVCATLAGCVSEPRDPAFAGAEAINNDEAAKTRVSLGLTYLNNGNFAQAKANLDKALEFSPRSANANFAMAFYYQQVDELGLANEYYDRALKYGPENADIINSYGAFLCEQGKYERAKSYFLRAVNNKSYVSTAETYENLAICAQDQGRSDEALTYFQSALNHQPTRSKSLYLLAQLQAQEGNFGDAKKTLWKYERVSQVSPQSLWLAYEIAQGLGDTKSALSYGEIMKSMYPDHPNTALFKKQMGKFQPVATVKSKRRVSVEPTGPAGTADPVPNQVQVEDKPSAAVTQAEDGAAEVVQVEEKSNPEPPKKKAMILAPTAVVEVPITTEETAESEEVAAQVATQATQSPKEDLKNNVESTSSTPAATVPAKTAPAMTKPSLSAEEVAKREAELEAAFDNAEQAVEEPAQVVPSEPLAELEKSEPKQVITDVAESQNETASESTQIVERGDSDDADKPVYHIVKPKENLYQISLRYNVKMKYLMQWNKLDDASSIQIGTKLRVKDPKSND
ncbi:type IV pilus biogenesis/stability protein PilW [Brumicola blandensis]|uniref:Type IV pilus biogenesis/stability protein PilW n=1 Tax=Brumicola blandensis TaxID=3075611 RepID=A0AAW8R9X5_9ALTE|nr:type IV pilus biogenesis/stability protein PilW [Alteromonas sp. W409]MDT0583993.1 type IV pilus biogenesis/stability protein PilW [Alteromonas sp. W409]